MIKAVGDNIIVEKVKTKQLQKKAEDELIRGLVGNEIFNEDCCDRPATTESNQREGIVVSVGDKVSKVKTGDSIIYKSWSSDSFTKDGKEYESVEEYGIIAAVTEEKK